MKQIYLADTDLYTKNVDNCPLPLSSDAVVCATGSGMSVNVTGKYSRGMAVGSSLVKFMKTLNQIIHLLFLIANS